MRMKLQDWHPGDFRARAFVASGGMAEMIENRLVRPLSGHSASWLAAGRLLLPTLLIAAAIGAAHHAGHSLAAMLFGAELLLAIGWAYFLALRGELFWPTRAELRRLVLAGAIASAPLLIPQLAGVGGLAVAIMPLAAIWLAPVWSSRLNAPQAGFAAILAVTVFTAPIACSETWPAIVSGSLDLGALGLGLALAAAYGLTCRDATIHAAA